MDRHRLRGGPVAFAHDYLTQVGGAERVAGLIARHYPDWDLYTSLHRTTEVPIGYVGGREWRTSFLQRAPGQVPLKAMLPLLPTAFTRFDLGGYELVVSSSSAFAHHVRRAAGARHVCYACTPPRFLWQSDAYFRDKPGLRALLAPLLHSLRLRDLEAAQGVDTYVAVSRHIAARIQAVYGKDARVVHPPVDCERFQPSTERSGRFLVLSRLVATKRVEFVVQAATDHGLPLDVIGVGPELSKLQRMAGPTVRFQGWQADDAVRDALAACQAVVVAGEEDFGLVMAEAQAAGRPPVAFGRGGAPEIIEDGLTGFLFEEQTTDAIAAAMRRAADRQLDVSDLRASALRFDTHRFWQRFEDVLSLKSEGGTPPAVLAGAGER